MKKIVLGIMAITMTVAAMAQTGDDKAGMQKPDKQEAKHDRFRRGENYDNLNLTDAQKQQLKTINGDFRKQMEDLHKQGNITVDEQKQRRQELMKAHQDKVEAILTPEQRKQAASFKDFKGMGGPRGDRFKMDTKNLNLTPDQTAKMSTLNATLKTKAQEIRQNNALSKDEKKSQLKNLMKQHRSDMEALLTNEQKQQLKNQRRNKPNRDAVK